MVKRQNCINYLNECLQCHTYSLSYITKIFKGTLCMVSLFKELKFYIALKFNRCDKHILFLHQQRKNVKYN